MSSLAIMGMAGEEMYDRFYQRGFDVNEDLFDRIKYLHSSEMTREYHFVCYTDRDYVVGDLALEQSPYSSEKDVLWLKHVSVDANYREKGIASRLLTTAFEYAHSHGKILQLSMYSDEGLQYLKPIMPKLRSKFPELVIKPSSADDPDDGLKPPMMR